MNSRPAITVEQAQEIAARHFPAVSGARPKFPPGEIVLSVQRLTDADIVAYEGHVASGRTIGVKPVDLKAIRNTHHRLAQMLAVGVDETVAAKLCNYGVARVSILKSDPAFAELLAHYAADVREEWADFVSTAANLSMDVMQEIQKRLDETPEQFTIQTLNDTLKTIADRSGHAPVQKTQNVNINVDMGSRLRAARERANLAELRNVTPESS
jgi:hypothetical protein